MTDVVPKGYPSWAPTERQSAFRLLSEHLPHLVHSLELDNASKWQRFSTSLEAEKDVPVLRGVSPFQRVLLIQAVRPDRLQSAILSFCCDLLRIGSVSPPPLSLAAIHSDSETLSPVLLISSPGADASKELEEYAGKTVGSSNYEELAMGGGQQEVAMQMLRNAAQNGNWLCLKNLHLVVAWLPQLEKELSSLQPHPDFRLWLTTEAHNGFPSILLQQSLKATYESPPGIKKNLQRTFDSWDPEILHPSQPLRSRLLFLLACFHAVIQERRTYIPQGWTKFYEFSYGDMRAGTFVIEAITEDEKKGQSTLDWETIHGLMEDAIYGGRVDNSFDLRVLRAYLSVFFCDRVALEGSGGVEILSGTNLRMPANPSYEAFRKIINQLPDTDAPFTFCLPDNIERSLQRSTSANVIKQLRALSAVDAEAQKYDRERWRAKLNPVLELWQQLTSSNPGLTKASKAAVGATGGRGDAAGGGGGGGAGGSRGVGKEKVVDPVDDFVSMENDLAADLCAQVDSSLGALRKVLFGSGLLTPVIQAAAKSLLADSVPADWNSRWEGPEKPQSWLRELIKKRLALGKWKTLCTKGALLDESLSLGDLFNPATFVNALRQQTARKLDTAIDRVKMLSSWDKDARRIRTGCPLPCSIANLILQGASFHGGSLKDSAPDATEMSTVPVVCIGFAAKDAPDLYSEDQAISIPVLTQY